MLGLTFAPLAFAQFSFGVKGGVPILGTIQTQCEFNAELNALLAPCYSTNTKRYIVGPTVEFDVFPKWAIELDALFNRTDYSGSDGIPSPTLPIGIGVISNRAAVNSWEFPLMVNRRFSLGRTTPFVDAGPSFRHVSVSSQVTTMMFGTPPNVTSFTTDHPNELQNRFSVGFSVGIGVEFRESKLHISPELRYTRWGFPNIERSALTSNPNQLEFVLGVTF